MRKIAIFLTLILLAACASFEYSPAPSPPQPFTIIHTPALAWMQDTLHLCATANPKIALRIQELPISALEIGAAEAILKLGPAPEELFKDVHTTLLGWENITIISSPDIPPSQLEQPDLQILYSAVEPAYQAWIYPQGSELSTIFNHHFLANEATSPHLLIAPDPEAMLEAISAQPNSVGFLPQSWLSDGVTVNIVQGEFRQPILAFTKNEPVGLTVEYLKCLEELLP
jgi:hypothetical protein